MPELLTVPCHPGNRGGTRRLSDVRYLVYHYTGNDGDTAMANAKYYRDNVVRASAHYFVDDREIVQSVADEEIAWAVGGRKWKDCAQTGGGTLHGVVTNANSISIEMCGTLGDGSRRASETTLRNAAALGRRLMARYGIPIERVVRHFDVTGKYCPAYLMDNRAWAAFKARLTQPEEEDMKRYQTMEEIRRRAPWAAETVSKLVGREALVGTGAGLDLSEDMLRTFVIHDRLGLYR